MVQKYNKRTRVSKVRVYRTANIWPYSFFHRNICEKHAPIRVPHTGVARGGFGVNSALKSTV